MGIADERRIAELRYRSSRNRVLIRVIFYVTSLIPAILLAINFEAFRQYAIVALGGQPQPVQQKPVQPQPQKSVPRRSTQNRTAPTINSRMPAPVPARQVETRIEVQPVPIKRRQPVQMLKPPKKPDFEITLDLSKSRQRYPVESTKVQVLPIGRTTMVPSDGILDAQNPVTLTFSNPFKPRITLSLDDDFIWLKYEVESANGKLIPFTTTNLASIRRWVMRNGKQATATVTRLNAERAKLDAYFNASGGKLWTEKQAAELRLKALPGLIAAANGRVSALQTDLRAVEALIQLAESIDGTKIGFVAVAGQKVASE